MKEFEAILKCINDKLADNEKMLEYYIDESINIKTRNLKLEEENKSLKEENEQLKKRNEACEDEIFELKRAIEILKAKVNELEKF